MNGTTEDNSKRFVIEPFVFFPAAALIGLFVLVGVVATEWLAEAVGEVQAFITETFGWFYIISVGFILLFVCWLMFSRFGGIVLGDDDEEPEFNDLTWFAMLFSAGMGIGLLFFSVAEPIMHYSSPPRAEAETVLAAKRAMNITFFHWGLHPWAVYSLVGLALAFFAYRRKLPLTIRSVFYPLLGKKIHGPIGHVIDTTAVVSTMFGVATSLGLGVMQINSGLHYVFPGVPEDSVWLRIGLIAIITTIATISVVSGVNVGIRRLSELNVSLGLLMCAFLLIAGPTVWIIRLFVQSIGHYLQNLPETTLWTATFEASDWLGGWTIFYWAWWIAWSPFVGMFVARVSRGRTVRQFVFGTLFCPTLATFFWLSIFGGSALHEEMMGAGGIVAAVNESVPESLFVLLERFPFAAITSVVALVVITSFFVTSSDSGSLVIDIITSGGDPDPPVIQRIFWAVTEGAVAATLLYTGYQMGTPDGGLRALQTASITTALPFTIVLLWMCWSLVEGFRREIGELPTTKVPSRSDDGEVALGTVEQAEEGE